MSANHFRLAVVDDDDTLLSMLTELLSEEGFVVEGFSDGFQAKEAAYERPFHVILTDINMPEMTGIELLRYLRDEIKSDAEVIIMTANAQLESAIEAVQLGAFDYVQKPFNELSDVVDLVNRAAEKILLKSRQDDLVKAVVDKTKKLLSHQYPEKMPEDLQGLLDRTEEMVKSLQSPEVEKDEGDKAEKSDGKLSGRVEEIGLPNLLQMLAIVGKSGILSIKEDDINSRIWFQNGKIIHAEFAQVMGEKAVFRILKADRGMFSFVVSEDPPLQSEIETHTDQLILNCLTSLDELNRLGPRVPPDNLYMKLLPQENKVLSANDQYAADLLTRHSRVQNVLDNSPKSDLETVYSLIRLRVAGFLDISKTQFR